MTRQSVRYPNPPDEFVTDDINEFLELVARFIARDHLRRQQSTESIQTSQADTPEKTG